MIAQVFINSLPGIGFLLAGLRYKRFHNNKLQSGIPRDDKKMKELRIASIGLQAFGVFMLVYGNWARIFVTSISV